MKRKEILAMGKEEQKARLNELRKELMKSNAQIATRTTPKSPGQVRQAKRTVARILTMMAKTRRKEEKA